MSDVLLERVRGRELVVPQVYAELRRAILRGKLRPGTRLVETRLADMLGVSRTPIREAVSKLEAEGLVVRQPSGGVVVGDTEAELLEIYGIRMRLEGYAARLAAERATPEERTELERAFRDGAAVLESHSADERAQHNRRFHRLIAEASHSPRLQRLIGEYYDYLLSEEMAPFHDPDLTLRHHREHEEILEAVRARDGARAEASIQTHLDSILRTLRHVLAERRAAAAAEPPDPE